MEKRSWKEKWERENRVALTAVGSLQLSTLHGCASGCAGPDVAATFTCVACREAPSRQNVSGGDAVHTNYQVTYYTSNWVCDEMGDSERGHQRLHNFSGPAKSREKQFQLQDGGISQI